MPAQTDVDADSSSAVAEDLDAQAVDTAQENQPETVPADGAETEQDADAKAGQSDAPSESQDEPASTITSAVDFLTRKNKKTAPEAPAKDATKEKAEEAKPEAAAETLTDEDKTLPARTQKRVRQLLEGQKAARSELETVRNEYEQAKPLIERGKAFMEVVKQFQLGGDLQGLEDEDVAGAIKFQASVRRLHAGKGSPQDMAAARSFYEQLDETRDALGIPSKSTLDPEALNQAIAKARDDFDYSDLEKIAKGLKAPPAPKVQTRTVAEPEPRQQEDQPQQRDSVNAVDDARYNAKAANRLTADGVKDARGYYEKQLLPRIYAELRTSFPGKNPAAVFDQLSPQGKYDEVISAHEAIRKAAQAAKPVPQTKTATPRPIASQSKSPGYSDGAHATSSGSAISFLSRER